MILALHDDLGLVVQRLVPCLIYLGVVSEELGHGSESEDLALDGLVRGLSQHGHELNHRKVWQSSINFGRMFDNHGLLHELIRSAIHPYPYHAVSFLDLTGLDTPQFTARPNGLPELGVRVCIGNNRHVLELVGDACQLGAGWLSAQQCSTFLE